MRRKERMTSARPDLLQDPVERLFCRYLAPSVSATLVTSIYILADTVLIGQGVGPEGIAALNLLLPVYGLFFATGLMAGVGGGVLLSISKGKGDERAAREYFTSALILAALAAVAYTVVFNLFLDPITAFLGSSRSLGPLVKEYGRILSLGAPVFVFGAFLQAFVRNDRAPKLAMAAVIAGGVSNVALDYVLIFPMGMGMAGGAVATVIGNGLTVAVLCTHFFSPDNTLKPVSGWSWKKGGRVLAGGLPSFLLDFCNGIVIFLFNRRLLGLAGDLGVVVYGIISNSALIVSSVCSGVAQAAQPLLATNFGAGKADRVKRTMRLAEITAGAVGALFLCLGFFFPRLIIRAFVSPAPEMLAMAVPAVRIYFLSFLAMGFNVLFGTYFQSVMKPGRAMTVCLLRGLALGGLFVQLLPLLFGVQGVWLTIVAAEFITLAVCLKLRRG